MVTTARKAGTVKRRQPALYPTGWGKAKRCPSHHKDSVHGVVRCVDPTGHRGKHANGSMRWGKG